MSSFNEAAVGFIGGGNMAQAIIRGLIHAGHVPGKISVADPAPEQQQAVRDIHADIIVTADNAATIGASNALVLAVKPQIMAEVCTELPVTAGQLVVSVAAGITLSSLQQWLGADIALVRVMPNQPALLGEGMSGLCANEQATSKNRDLAGYLLEATGKTVWFDDEAMIDAVTAVSGSGPAYFYLVMEIMSQVAEELGFDAETARLLSTQTALGAARVAVDGDDNLTELRERVTSPGGTTAAALASLEADAIRDTFRKALQAAHARSIELGKID